MDNHRSSTSSKHHIVGIPAFLVVVALLVCPQVGAQQQQLKLTTPYAKAALLSLRAIASDVSAPQDKKSETVEVSKTQSKIDAADAEAFNEEEESVTKVLRQIYRLRLQDNHLLRAYRKLSEIENAQDASDQDAPEEALVKKKKKDYAVSQLADNEAAINKREETCFGQLEKSLRQGSPENVTACSEWIRKAKISDENPLQVSDQR